MGEAIAPSTRLTGAARLCLACAVILYAVFSSPTPDAPGAIEFCILLLLAIATCAFRAPRDAWAQPFAVFLAYGICASTAIGVLWGHGGGSIARDLIAFGALAMPFLYGRLYEGDDHQLFVMLLCVGLAFAFRYLIGAADHLAYLGLNPLDHHFLYLANSPLVAFSAAWLLLHGCFAERRAGLAIICILFSLVPLASMVGMMQRATLGLLALAWLVFFVQACISTPGRAVLLALGVAAFCAVIWPLPLYVIESLSEKTLNVGWNARESELTAVMDIVAQNPVTAIFGSGWGALMKAPSVGNEWVRFSHSLASSLLWKTGFVGLVLGALALGALLAAARKRLQGDAILATALILPLLPALFLYGSYKSLCFGLLLLGVARLKWTRLKWTNTRAE